MSNVPGLIDPRTPKRLVGCELVNLEARDPRRLVELSERQYAGRIRAAADQILSTGRHIVMVTGPSAAGKTTSSRKLADELRRRGVRSEVLSLDDFFVGAGRYPKLPDGSDDYECVEALDLPVLHKCLQSLAETGECDAPVFDFLTQLPTGEKRHINCSGGVAIVEGLHAFNPALTAPLPEGAVLNIYASLREEYAGSDGQRLIATRDVRLARRMTRDWKFRGHDADFTMSLWPHVCKSEDLYIKAFKKRADLVLDTSFSCEAGIWEQYVEQLTASAHTERLATLRRKFAAFDPIDSALIPPDSMLREFIGPDGGNA